MTYDQASITTRYEGDSVNRGGLQHLNIEQRYEFGDDAIRWTLTLHNTADTQIVIGELGLPITLNTNYNIGDEKQGFNHRSIESTKYVFEQRVIESSFVSGHASYILVSRASGKGDHLLIIPQGDTALEAISGYGLFPEYRDDDGCRLDVLPILRSHSGGTLVQRTPIADFGTRRKTDVCVHTLPR